MILAIDTATQFAGLALYNEDGIFAEETWYAERNHTTELMPRLSRMLNLAKLEVVHLTALAVSLGPGSFTGLRIGLAIAKGLALPHKLPVVGVPTLEITAYPFRDIKLPVWSVAQAGRGRLLAACFDRQDDRWQAIIAPHLTTIETLAEKIEHFVLFVGEIDQAAAKELQRHSHHKAQIVSPATRLRRPGYLAEIAAYRLKASDQDDPDALVPIYASSP
jgi:tRNA threonylcarbamoyladenosine biosynthesis protein TsaB